jgi:hypothetical protein
MRMRAFAIVVLLAAATATAAPVRVTRYDATFVNGEFAALCVVPDVVKKEGARFICYYTATGQQKLRDDTDGNGLQPVGTSDPNFSVWLNNRHPDGGCVLSMIATDAQFPTQQLLATTCPDVVYANGNLSKTSAATFVDDVRKAVAETLPNPAASTPPAVAGPAPPALATATTDPAVAIDTTSNVISEPVTQTDTQPPAPIVNPNPETVEPKKKSASLAAWATTGILLFIAVLVAAMFLERVWQFFQRRRVLKLAVTDEVVKTANTAELAATMLQRQRDEARQLLDDTKKKLDAAEAAVADVERALALEKGADRSARIAALMKLERGVELLAPGAAIPLASIEEELKERAAMEQILGGKQANLLKYVRDSNQLVITCSNAFWGYPKTPYDLRTTVDDVMSAVKRACALADTSASQEQSVTAMLATIEQALRKVPDLQQRLEIQNRTLATVRSFVAAQWPNIAGDLDSTVPTLGTRMRDARAMAAMTSCAADGDIDAVVTELAARVEHERNASRGAQEILGRVRSYLALPDQDAEALNAVIRAELGTPRRILRLVLAAAVPVMHANVAELAHDDVVRMLRIPEIADALDAFLGRLWMYEGDQLWSIGIQSGLAQDWLHHIFRAEAVLRTYFMPSRLADLYDVVSAVAWTFRYTTGAAGYELDRVQLLTDLPAQMDQAPDSPREFRLCPDIRTRVQSVLKTQRDGGFTVDVDSVGLRNGGKVLKRGALVLANRHDWEG